MALLFCEEMISERVTRVARSRLAVRHQQADSALQGLQPGPVPGAATCATPCFLCSNAYLICYQFITHLMAAA